jgi:hypothetical protein
MAGFQTKSAAPGEPHVVTPGKACSSELAESTNKEVGCSYPLNSVATNAGSSQDSIKQVVVAELKCKQGLLLPQAWHVSPAQLHMAGTAPHACTRPTSAATVKHINSGPATLTMGHMTILATIRHTVRTQIFPGAARRAALCATLRLVLYHHKRNNTAQSNCC